MPRRICSMSYWCVMMMLVGQVGGDVDWWPIAYWTRSGVEWCVRVKSPDIVVVVVYDDVAG